jgi:ATP phosphoribosyltransferase
MNPSSIAPETDPVLRLALPKGRMQDAVTRLLADAGIHVRQGARNYRPTITPAGFEAKILKPQTIIEMLHTGSRDVGFAGADWVVELGAELTLLLDTGLDPVRIVAAAPRSILVDGRLPLRPLVVATEYVNLARAWIEGRGLTASIVRSHGATEVFPPEDADLIVDNSASGATLLANDLVVVDELMTSSTRLYGHRALLADPRRARAVADLVMLLRSVLDARRRVMVEVNVTGAQLEAVCACLPCMREPTIATLHGGAGYAVKAAVPSELLPTLIPKIKVNGGTDIIVSPLAQIVA